MFVKQPDFQVENRLSYYTEPEVPGLNDSCMDRPYRDLVHTFTVHMLENIRFPRVFDSLDFPVLKRFEERVKIFRVCLMQKEPPLVKGIHKLYPKPVSDFSFIPACRGENSRNRCRFRHDLPHKRKHVGKTAQSENIKQGKIRISLKTLDAEKADQDKALLGKNRHSFQKILFTKGDVKFIIIYPNNLQLFSCCLLYTSDAA